MDEFEDAIKARHRLLAPGVSLQEEGAGITLDAQVFGARCRFDAEREEVVVVRAVAHQEGARGLCAQQGAGLLPAHSAPVEAALLQFAHSREHHLILRPRTEGLVPVGGQGHAAFKGAAAHGAVKPTVRYHGALPAPCTARQPLVLGVQGRRAVPARVLMHRRAPTQRPELWHLFHIQKKCRLSWYGRQLQSVIRLNLGVFLKHSSFYDFHITLRLCKIDLLLKG